ncbi:hypothetical protein ACA910_018665 [Epithemia clementina (nom. ined.)]
MPSVVKAARQVPSKVVAIIELDEDHPHPRESSSYCSRQSPHVVDHVPSSIMGMDTTSSMKQHQHQQQQQHQHEGMEDIIASLDQAMEQSRSLARAVITCEAVRVNKRLIAEHQYHHHQQQLLQQDDYYFSYHHHHNNKRRKLEQQEDVFDGEEMQPEEQLSNGATTKGEPQEEKQDTKQGEEDEDSYSVDDDVAAAAAAAAAALEQCQQRAMLQAKKDQSSELLYHQAARSCRMIRLLKRLETLQAQIMDDIMASADDADLRYHSHFFQSP